MKNFLLFILGAFLFVSCSKSSGGNVKPATDASLSGTYVLYEHIDTDFNDNQSVESITIKNSISDIEYLNPGTPYYLVENFPGYNPAITLADTLRFTSATAGNENQNGDRYPFTYSLKNNIFDDGDPYAASSGITTALFQKSSSVIEILSTQKIDGLLQDTGAGYWKKL